MITKKIGNAMAVATTRHNGGRQAKLTVFNKALKTLKTETINDGESKVVFNGTLRGQSAQIFLLKVGGRTTLNLIRNGQTFSPLLMTEMTNENDYLKWNAKITVEMDGPKESSVQPPARPTQKNKITNPKAINKKAKTHDVIPLDHDTFRVKSSSSSQEYLVRLLPNEDGGTCNCNWGKYRRYQDGHRSGCSHVQAVYQQMESHRSRSTSAWSTVEDAKRQMAHIGDGVTLTLRKKTW